MNESTRSNTIIPPADASDPAGYERDFVLWIDTQLEILRARKFELLDLDNIIEEFEAMGRNQRRELKSRLRVLLIHLLKCQFQPDRKSRSWLDTLKEQRIELRDLLTDSPSLRRHVAEVAATTYNNAVERAVIQTGMDRRCFPDENPYTAEQLLDSNFVP